MLRLLLIFLFTGLIGWGISRPKPPTAGELPSASKERPDAAKKTLGYKTPDDLARWAAERAPGMSKLAYTHTSHDAELAEWSIDELRAALAKGITDPACARYGPEMSALSSLVNEFARRDPDAAWSWFESIPSEAMRARLGGALARGWPADRAEEALDLVVAHPDYFQHGGGYGYSPIIHKAFESAAARGPAATDALMAMVREQGMQYPIEGLKFPPGFDFAAWARSPATARFLAKGDKIFFSDAWMAESPEGAFDGLLALNRENGTDLSRHLFEGLRRITEKDPELLADRARRLGAKTGGLPEEEQRVLFEAGAKELTESPQVLASYLNAIPDPAMRAEANLAAASSLMAKDLPSAVGFLEAGSEPETRLDLLEQYLEERPKDGFGRGLSGEDEQKVRKLLAGWDADPERLEKIIATMKKIPRS